MQASPPAIRARAGFEWCSLKQPRPTIGWPTIHSGCPGRRSQGRPQCFYVPHRGFSEEALVLPIELAWTFVSHREGRTRSIEFLGEHLLPCCTEPKLFLKLKRTHCRETTELMMQS